jgi:hypothetical protein
MNELDPTLNTPPNMERVIVRRPEILEMPFRIDAFIIHGKNWVKYPPGRLARRFHREEAEKFRLKLSRDSRITALATGMLWRHFAQLQPDSPPLLIFSTGKTAGKAWPSEAEAMVEYMKRRFFIPDEYIALEDKSYDTPGNITESKKILEGVELSEDLQAKLKGKQLRNVGYLTIGYHNPRVARLMDYYDVPINVIFPTEQIVRGRSRRHDNFVRQYLESDEWRKQVRREDILNAGLLILDRN